MRILITHPEGNLNYNPSLLGMIEILAEAGHKVVYLGRKRDNIHQHPELKNALTIFMDAAPALGTFIFGAHEAFRGFDLIVGVDRGIIEAAQMAKLYQTPLGLISYEIFFKEEVEASKKLLEIDACREIAFAIVPDQLRAAKLSEANSIPPDKMVRIPVSGRGYQAPAEKPRLIHEIFGLEQDQKVALYMGFLADWTAARYLIESTRFWPTHWTLVLHERFGPSQENLSLIEKHGCKERIRTSYRSYNSLQEMRGFIASASLGVAIYTPTYANDWVGRNIKYIGLSSGKISTYLQHGVPVATNNLGQITQLLKNFGAGFEFSLDEVFLPRDLLDSSAQSCRVLFEEKLNLDRHIGRLLGAIEKAHSAGIRGTR